MSAELQLIERGELAVAVRRAGGGCLLRYVLQPETPADEAPRPYLHPVCSLAGEVLTNFRPNDHRWHHGLSYTLASVAGVNFWGGPSYRAADGYQWRGDHGRQRHLEWLERTPERLSHRVAWEDGSGFTLLEERRTLSIQVMSERAWSLRWQATLENVAGRELELGHYQSLHGLTGSHYTGLQFRGARDLLDEHGDPAVTVVNAVGAAGEAEVHGAPAEWMEWRGQKDESQRRVSIRFANGQGPLHWFVRRKNPIAAFPFPFDRPAVLAPGAAWLVDHLLTFTDA